MKYYQELTLIPDADISLYFLWSKIYTQLHIALADVRNRHGIDSIGVSFPEYHFEQGEQDATASLGRKLRIFAPDKQALVRLDIERWLERFSDYVHIKGISEVGDKARGHLIVRRYRQKPMKQKAQQYAEFKNIPFQAAMAHCKAYKKGVERYPFITLTSQSNTSSYRLGIWQQPCQQANAGSFGSYGINGMAGNVTVPHW